MRISENLAMINGGGIYAQDGAIVGCHVMGNTAELGGGKYLTNFRRVFVVESAVDDNVARLDGGGVYGHGAVEGNSFRGNHAERNGGGLFLTDGECHQQQCA